MDNITVWYDPRMAANARSFSPSAGKAPAVIAAWTAAGLPIHIAPPEPCTINRLKLAHDAAYVDGIMAGRIENGFGNTYPEVANAALWQVGSMIDAAVDAIVDGSRISCSPSSGFHHAHHDHARGFCTFNGLMVAALRLLDLGIAKRVGILDLDFHYGDGTENILDTTRSRSSIQHFTAGKQYQEPGQGKSLLRDLTSIVKGFHGVDVLLYQAGADQHIEDPLGGLLTDEQMAQRDRLVFWACREYRIPLAWNLAGGYRRDDNGSIAPVVATHTETMRQCVEVYLRDGGRRL